MQFDECTAFHVDRDYTEESMHRSHRWGDRCLEHFEKSDDGAQAVYGIIQGGVYEDLRAESCAWTKNGNFFGTAIGGSLGGSKQQFYEIVSWCTQQIHQERPVHLLGIGAIDDIFKCVRLGIDTFDCVSPTRAARHGWAIMKGVPGNRINIKNAKYREDPTALFPDSDIKASNFYTKAYIHHLIKAKEMLGMQILSQHNDYMMNMLMRDIREAIANDTLDSCEKEWRAL
jgi:queuine tRNA-ribosyltransferase